MTVYRAEFIGVSASRAARASGAGPSPDAGGAAGKTGLWPAAKWQHCGAPFQTGCPAKVSCARRGMTRACEDGRSRQHPGLPPVPVRNRPHTGPATASRRPPANGAVRRPVAAEAFHADRFAAGSRIGAPIRGIRIRRGFAPLHARISRPAPAAGDRAFRHAPAHWKAAHSARTKLPAASSGAITATGYSRRISGYRARGRFGDRATRSHAPGSSRISRRRDAGNG